MRFFAFILFASLVLFQTQSIADQTVDSADGNLIPEPTLSDYNRAERTPGFSQITDIIDENGLSVSN